jgi:hypothetical protein
LSEFGKGWWVVVRGRGGGGALCVSHVCALRELLCVGGEYLLDDGLLARGLCP